MSEDENKENQPVENEEETQRTKRNLSRRN